MSGTWAAIPFLASLILLVAFFALRTWEEKRGMRVFGNVRAAADTAVEEWYRRVVIGDIPAEYRRAFVAFLHRASHTIVVLTVEVLRAIERPLMRLSYRMRRGVPQANGKGPSEFLKTITPTKKTDASESKPDSV